MPAPPVSIILCTYNRGHLLGRAIRSVLRQSWKDWELIVVDDGSTDGTGAALQTLVRSHPRIRYIRQPNGGVAAARNAGMRRARGRFIAFLDSDDEYTPGHLATRLRYLRKHRNLEAVYGLLTPVGPRRRGFVPDVDRPGKRIHVSRCHGAGTLVARRSALRRLGGFGRLPFSEDYDLIRRLEARHRTRQVRFRTYRYHVEADDRLCWLFEMGGKAGIRRYRRRGVAGL
jgi:glycosyltransferase involved in cell wall biosynthesis